MNTFPLGNKYFALYGYATQTHVFVTCKKPRTPSTITLHVLNVLLTIGLVVSAFTRLRR